MPGGPGGVPGLRVGRGRPFGKHGSPASVMEPRGRGSSQIDMEGVPAFRFLSGQALLVLGGMG